MLNLKSYFNNISLLTDKTWDRILPMFRQEALSKNQFFAKENEVARKIGFLDTGVVKGADIKVKGLYL